MIAAGISKSQKGAKTTGGGLSRTLSLSFTSLMSFNIAFTSCRPGRGGVSVSAFGGAHRLLLSGLRCDRGANENSSQEWVWSVDPGGPLSSVAPGRRMSNTRKQAVAADGGFGSRTGLKGLQEHAATALSSGQ